MKQNNAVECRDKTLEKGNVVDVANGKAIIILALINKKTGLPLLVAPVEIEVQENK